MSVQAKSGSELLLGVRSEPKTRLSLSVTLCPLSSTICVNRTETAKWFKPFVRGTFETEKLRKLSGPDPWGTVRIEKNDCSMPRKIVTKCEGSL